MDEFTLSGGIVLDFEVGIDRLYLDTSSYTLSSWADVTTPYGPAAQIHLTQPNDDRTVTLVGVSADTMNSLPIGFDTVSGAQNTSGPGNDFFYDRYAQRSRQQGHVEPENVEQFKLILKHMAQALTLAVRLGTLDQQCRFDLALIDAMPQAVFALDRAGKVVMTNARAEGLLGEGDALVAFDGKLQCRLGSDQARFDSAVAAALDAATIEHKGGWVRIERMSSRRALMAFVAPLISSESPFGGVEPKALIIIGDAAEALAVDEKALHDLFNLTQVEARLACALSAGHSIESAAALFGVQPETVRSELKSVFRKTSVNRQQDLVRLITSLSLTARGPSARA
jgi:DNA-binding CsgD family transcriptional regulator/PAS domain-containing protein